MGKIKYSIVIPTKDRGKLCQRLIDSIELAIIYSKLNVHLFELLIVNDGKINCSFSSNLIKLKLFFNNNGHNAAYSRNRGAKNAKGDYIVFLDDDVIVEKTFFHDVENIINKFEPDILSGAILPEKNNISTIFFTLLLSCCRKFNFMSTSNLIIKKYIFLQNLFNESEDIVPIEDYFFFLSIQDKNYSIIYSKKPFIKHALIKWKQLFVKLVNYAKAHKKHRKEQVDFFNIKNKIEIINNNYSLRDFYVKESIFKKLLLNLNFIFFLIVVMIINPTMLLSLSKNRKSFFRKIYLRGNV